jgi:hypothetical protein
VNVPVSTEGDDLEGMLAAVELLERTFAAWEETFCGAAEAHGRAIEVLYGKASRRGPCVFAPTVDSNTV